MSDVFTRDKRSAIMKRIHSSGNTSTELRLIQLFHKHGIVGWRRHYAVKGHPDFVFLDKRIAVFVDGCFRHGHDCRNTVPKDNAEYWVKKRERNIVHDKTIIDLFISRGWNVVRIWECALSAKNAEATLNEKLIPLLKS